MNAGARAGETRAQLEPPPEVPRELATARLGLACETKSALMELGPEMRAASKPLAGGPIP